MPTTTDHFSSRFKIAAERLAATEPNLFRRQALAPDVRWGIVQSKYGRHCGEVRWPDPEIQAQHPAAAWRGLFIAHPDGDWYVFTILGNKAGADNAWHDDAVVQSDELVATAIDRLGVRPVSSSASRRP